MPIKRRCWHCGVNLTEQGSFQGGSRVTQQPVRSGNILYPVDIHQLLRTHCVPQLFKWSGWEGPQSDQWEMETWALSVTKSQDLSADQECVIWLKVPGQLLHRPWGGDFFLICRFQTQGPSSALPHWTDPHRSMCHFAFKMIPNLITPQMRIQWTNAWSVCFSSLTWFAASLHAKILFCYTLRHRLRIHTHGETNKIWTLNKNTPMWTYLRQVCFSDNK